MRRTKLETAKKLAEAHRSVDSDLKHVYLIEPLNEIDKNDPIRLLEIVEGTLELGIEPISFAADPGRGIEYPSIIVEISPKEFKKREQLKSALSSRGWRLGAELAG